MHFDDDIRRDISEADYERVTDDFVREFTHDALTLCMYGGRRPPTSDLDLLVLFDPALPASEVKRVRTRLDAFRTASAEREYIVCDTIGLCPRDLFTTARQTYPNLLPGSYRYLAGPHVDLGCVDGDRFVHLVLLDYLLMELNDIGWIRRSPTVSTREALSILHKLSSVVRPQIDRVLGIERRADGDAIARAFAEVISRTADLRARAIAPSPDAAFDTALDTCLQDATALLVSSMSEYSTRFLRTVVRPADNAAAQSMEGDAVHPLVRCHQSAFAQTTDGPSRLRVRLRDASSGRRVSVLDSEYGDTLQRQLRVVSEFDARFKEYGIPSVSIAICGFWHTWEPARGIDRLREFMSGAASRLTGADRH